MQSIRCSCPEDLISIDILHFILVDTNTFYSQWIIFTQFLQAYATKNKEAKTAAQFLYAEYIQRFGIPAKLVQDQRTEFENEIFEHLQKVMGIQHLRTTSYHPQGNGQWTNVMDKCLEV